MNSAPAGVTWLGQDATSYVQDTTAVNTEGLTLNLTNYTTLTGAPVDPFGWTSGAPKSITGSIANPSTGQFGNYLVNQLVVASTTATTGAITAEVWTYAYDES